MAPPRMQEDETEFSPHPPILREEITSEMKTLLADVKYPQLNNFSLSSWVCPTG
jgi:hypothetical protein